MNEGYLTLFFSLVLLVSLISLWLLLLFEFVRTLDSVNRKSRERIKAHNRRYGGIVEVITREIFGLKIKRLVLGAVVFGPLVLALFSFL